MYFDQKIAYKDEHKRAATTVEANTKHWLCTAGVLVSMLTAAQNQSATRPRS